jgi:hypothetical protein
MRPFSLLLIAAAAVLLAGCTPMEWVREDTSAEQLQQDSIQCQQAAWREARSLDWQYAPFGAYPFRDPFVRRLFWPYGPYAYSYPFGDPYLEEGRLAQFCMRNKGYRLEPREKTPPSG